MLLKASHLGWNLSFESLPYEKLFFFGGSYPKDNKLHTKRKKEKKVCGVYRERVFQSITKRPNLHTSKHPWTAKINPQ
jgi:hypothetical protein